MPAGASPLGLTPAQWTLPGERFQEAAGSKCHLFPGLNSLDPALPLWGPELRAILEGPSVGRERLGDKQVRAAPGAWHVSVVGKRGGRGGGGQVGSQGWILTRNDPVAGGLETPLFQLSTQRPGGRVLGTVWPSCPGLSSQPDPAPFSPLSPHLPAQMKGCVCGGGGVFVCVCVANYSLCANILEKSFSWRLLLAGLRFLWGQKWRQPLRNPSTFPTHKS